MIFARRKAEMTDAARALPGVNVYGAGVASDDDGALITSGGRVLSVCGRGVDVVEARERAYAGVAELRWRGMTVRTDIASTAART